MAGLESSSRNIVNRYLKDFRRDLYVENINENEKKEKGKKKTLSEIINRRANWVNRFCQTSFKNKNQNEVLRFEGAIQGARNIPSNEKVWLTESEQKKHEIKERKRECETKPYDCIEPSRNVNWRF